jgi:hypothetical protein
MAQAESRKPDCPTFDDHIGWLIGPALRSANTPPRLDDESARRALFRGAGCR